MNKTLFQIVLKDGNSIFTEADYYALSPSDDNYVEFKNKTTSDIDIEIRSFDEVVGRFNMNNIAGFIKIEKEENK